MMQFLTAARLTFLIALSSICLHAQGQGEKQNATAQVDTSRWRCLLCPFPHGWSGELNLGSGWVSDDSNKFGDYRGLEEQGFFPALDGRMRYQDQDGRYFSLRSDDLGVDSRRFTVQGGIRGKYSARAAYREIPRYRGFGTATVFEGVGSNMLSLPFDWQPARSTTDMARLTESLQAISLKSTRRIFDAGLTLKMGRRWSYDIEFQHQRKSGTRPSGNGVFTVNSSHVPTPIDFMSNRLEMAINFAGKKGRWRLGLMGSEFDNANTTLTWENPFTPTSGTEVLRTALEPDNTAYHVNFAGTWTLNPGLRFSTSAVAGRLEQDETLLPYSINPEFRNIPLPRFSAGTSIDVGTLDISGKLTARLAPRLDLTARLNRFERDNDTPTDLWTPVITDLVIRGQRPNRPYSFERDRASVSLRYRLKSRIRLQAGVKREDFKRTLQSVADSDEGSYFLESRTGVLDTVDLRVRFEQSARDGDPYVQVEDFALPEHPLMRKFNLADRDRSRFQIDIDYFPASDLALTFSYRQAQDDYEQSVLGLQSSDEQTLSVDLNWNPLSDFSAHAFVSYDEVDSTIRGEDSDATQRWTSETSDSFLTTGLGLGYHPDPQTEISLEYVRSDAEGDISTRTSANELPFPTLVTDLRNARLRISRQFTNNWGVRLYLEHENYRSTDWALDGLGFDGISSILTFGAKSPDYSVTLVRAQAIYRF